MTKSEFLKANKREIAKLIKALNKTGDDAATEFLMERAIEIAKEKSYEIDIEALKKILTTEMEEIIDKMI